MILSTFFILAKVFGNKLFSYVATFIKTSKNNLFFKRFIFFLDAISMILEYFKTYNIENLNMPKVFERNGETLVYKYLLQDIKLVKLYTLFIN